MSILKVPDAYLFYNLFINSELQILLKIIQILLKLGNYALSCIE